MRKSALRRQPQALEFRTEGETPRRASLCRVVPYCAEHQGLVAELQRHLWSPDPRLNASYLEWKYHQNPYILDPLIYLAFVGDKLVGMGARIILCDPHRAVVSGPARLFGQRMASPDIRAGMAMLIAGLCAEGISTIGNVGEIDRGYERIDERLRSLGARIERVEG